MAKTKKQSVSPTFIVIMLACIAVLAFVFSHNKMNFANSTPPLQLEQIAQTAQLSQKECSKSGDPIIDIHEKIVNDADIANGNVYWANDIYDQYIKVWKQTDTLYCAEITFAGTYDAQPGKMSPGNKKAILTGDEDGTLHGSSKIVIMGTLKTYPDWPTTGFVGTTDLQCDLEGNCQDYESKLWYNKYFENIQPGYPKDEWHEWIYQNGEHEWTNASGGNRGEDIL